MNKQRDISANKVIPADLKYGICRLCDGYYDHAGLDHSHCPKCGWVPELKWLATQQTEAELPKPKRKKKA